ncbi:MAG: polysaccharide deacetylase family protein [Actinomycetota bacterium]|nr:polysaccharide deacetylase family protein [Actinomycetota bacterium]MDP3629339.1 polysaccharide deacetylase family protein [Actinomycetota bacterium]
MQTNPTHTNRLGLSAIMTALAVFAVLALLAQGLFGRVPVVLDGVPASVGVGDSLGEALAERPSLTRSGDLLAVTDGRVVLKGGGEPAHVRLNGQPVAPDVRIAPGDTIEVERGADAVERTAEETRAITIPTKVVGEGAILTMVAPGSVGVQRVSVGTVSGDVVTSETVVPPEPMILRRMSGDRKRVVALTFDDGPWPGQTDKILDILKREQVPATFFALGVYVNRHPGLVAREIREGHDVGNHTYYHPNLTTADPKKLQREIAGTSAAIKRAGGESPKWFRPPMGLVNEQSYALLKAEKIRPVLWTVDPQDWHGDAEAWRIERVVVDSARPGSVILLHDGGGNRTETTKALPGIIRALRKRGYEFVLLDGLPQAPKARW